MSKTIAVTGASGHLGNIICRLLLQKSYKVHAFYNSDKKALEDLDVELFQGSVLNKNDLFHLLKDCDAVINCAGIISIHGDPDGRVHQTNTEGPKNVLNVCMELGIKKIIHVSSVHAVLEHPLEEPFDETRDYKQPGAYAYDYSKAVGEQIVLTALNKKEIGGCIVRPSLIIGPYDFKPSEMGKALIDFYKQKIPALPKGGYNFIDVRDASASIVEALDKGRDGEIYHLTGYYRTLKELAAIIQKVTGKKVPKLVLPFWMMKTSLPFIKIHSKLTGAAPVFTKEAVAALKYGHPGMVNAKAVNELDHAARSLEDSVRDFYTWQKEMNHIH
ncbi:MAG: hypothetical protein JWP12_3036 [Bacteroidetes bacterium]|nr:hypothetical protein [Bacteroidota bacterium]